MDRGMRRRKWAAILAVSNFVLSTIALGGCLALAYIPGVAHNKEGVMVSSVVLGVSAIISYFSSIKTIEAFRDYKDEEAIDKEFGSVADMHK